MNTFWATILVTIINFMIKILRRAGRMQLLQFPTYYYMTQADPYYILGVQKTTSFHQIKLAFYRLANEFHPDKNDSNQAQKKFVIIKQAFESIKMQKGLMKPQHLYSSDQQESMRPAAHKYSMDEQEGAKSFRDYRVYSEKAGENEQYMRFNSSFKTINDINQIKIKVEEGQMKDPMNRFGLDRFKGRISSYSESGNKYFFVIMTGLTIFTILTNQLFNDKEVQAKEGALKKLTQVQKRRTIEADLVQNRKVDIRNMEQSPVIMSLRNKEIREEVMGGGGKLLADRVVVPEQVDHV